MILSILHPVTWNNMCQQKIEFQAAAASSSSSSPKPLLSSIVFENPEISVCWRRSHRSLHHHHGCYCSGPSLAAGWQNDRSNIKYVSRWTTSLLFNAIQAATAAAEKIAKPWYQAQQPPSVSSVARSSRHYHRLSFAREEKNNSRCEKPGLSRWRRRSERAQRDSIDMCANGEERKRRTRYCNSNLFVYAILRLRLLIFFLSPQFTFTWAGRWK